MNFLLAATMCQTVVRFRMILFFSVRTELFYYFHFTLYVRRVFENHAPDVLYTTLLNTHATLQWGTSHRADRSVSNLRRWHNIINKRPNENNDNDEKKKVRLLIGGHDALQIPVGRAYCFYSVGVADSSSSKC